MHHVPIIITIKFYLKRAELLVCNLPKVGVFLTIRSFKANISCPFYEIITLLGIGDPAVSCAIATSGYAGSLTIFI